MAHANRSAEDPPRSNVLEPRRQGSLRRHRCFGCPIQAPFWLEWANTLINLLFHSRRNRMILGDLSPVPATEDRVGGYSTRDSV